LSITTKADDLDLNCKNLLKINLPKAKVSELFAEALDKNSNFKL